MGITYFFYGMIVIQSMFANLLKIQMERKNNNIHESVLSWMR